MKKTIRLIALALASAALSVSAFAAPSVVAADAKIKSVPIVLADTKIDKASPAMGQVSEKKMTHAKGTAGPIILASAKADKAKQHVKKAKTKAKKAVAAKKK
ncbi:MAG: hypothetical protein WC790_02900 [Candidatus Paceibacterota bacterium]|jgi:hypothetical protein